MSKTPFIVFGIFAAVCVLGLPFLALGKEGDQSAATVEVAGQDEEAKDLFAANCGTCHTLAAAGTDGIVGPDLDEILVPTGSNDPQQYESIYTRVLTAVTCGIRGRMPKGIVVGEEAQEVARFVAAYAGQIGKGPTLDTGTAEAADPPAC
jgi:mono/diheme cytochrome c family protein